MVFVEAPFRVRVENTPVKTGYFRYQELGGTINEDDYNDALRRAGKTTLLKTCLVTQVETIVRVTGVPLDNKKCFDKITILYGILRTDPCPGLQYHYSQMCDQRLFVEALRMLDYPDWVEQVIAVYPNISFT